MKKSIRSEVWAMLSKCIRKENPTCEVCRRKPSTEVHHIIPRARGNMMMFLERNLVSIDSGCHLNWEKRWSPDEIAVAVKRIKGDFDDVEVLKWLSRKINKREYAEMLQEYKERYEK